MKTGTPGGFGVLGAHVRIATPLAMVFLVGCEEAKSELHEQ